MSKSKLGKSADNIFAPKPIQHEKPALDPITHNTEMVQEEETKLSRGRPVEHKETWSKITVVLLDRQIHWLDQLGSQIRLNTKVAISRAELIRAVIAAIEESKIDLSNIESEQLIKKILLEKLKS